MTHGPSDDPLDELRRSDPAPLQDVPAASLARVRARTQEVIKMEQQRQRAPWRLAAGVSAAVAALALVAIVALPGNRSGTQPTASAVAVVATSPSRLATAQPKPSAVPAGSPTAPAGGGGGLASCVEQYSIDTLKKRQFAFDGTVASIAGDEVTFGVNKSYKGNTGDRVTLTATGMTGTTITSAGGPTLAVGKRYLVAGEDHFAWGCGFTQDYDAGVAASWASALR